LSFFVLSTVHRIYNIFQEEVHPAKKLYTDLWI